MSEIWIPAAGGGADLDVVTAQAGDVLQDKVIVGPDGEPLTGTMPNRGNYNGSGNSKGNDAGNQRMWVKVPKGYYNENAQVFLSWADIRQMAGIRPEVIKKNVSIIGITGSWEGWVPDPQDLYYNGVKVAGWEINSSRMEYKNTIIDFIYSSSSDFNIINFTKTFDVRSYSKLIIDGKFSGNGSELSVTLAKRKTSGSTTISQFKSSSTTRITLDITQVIQLDSEYFIYVNYFGTGSGQHISRIRFA